MTDEDRPLRATVKRLRDALDGPGLRDHQSISVEDIVEALGDASFAALLFVPALLVVSPLSGVPGLSSFFGISLALIAVQMVLGRNHVWLPRWLMRQHIDHKKVDKGLDAVRRPVDFIDRITRPRLQFLVKPPGDKLLEIICVLCGLAMPFLELVPFSSSLLGTTIALLAASMVTRDGIFALAGLCFLAVAVGLVGFLVRTGLNIV